MPHCGVLNCRNNSKINRDIKFYVIPKFTKESCDVALNLRQKMKNKQCVAWVKAINRSSLSVNVRICSKHFSSGKPTHWCDTNNCDWFPHFDMGYTFNSNTLDYLRQCDNPTVVNINQETGDEVLFSQCNEVPLSSESDKEKRLCWRPKDKQAMKLAATISPTQAL